MPIYTLPDFNLALDWWQPANVPVVGPPDYAGVPAQLFLPSRSPFNAQFGFLNVPTWYVQIRTPTNFKTLTGIPPPYVSSIFANNVEAGWPWYYIVIWWQTQHLGFPNEYTLFECVQCSTLGIYPDPGR